MTFTFGFSGLTKTCCFKLHIIKLITIFFLFNSYDARGAAIGKGSHWADDVTLSNRGYFKAKPNPSILSIDSTKSLDSGVYRCRVDFHKSPTRNSKVNLTIISKLNLCSLCGLINF